MNHSSQYDDTINESNEDVRSLQKFLCEQKELLQQISTNCTLINTSLQEMIKSKNNVDTPSSQAFNPNISSQATTQKSKLTRILEESKFLKDLHQGKENHQPQMTPLIEKEFVRKYNSFLQDKKILVYETQKKNNVDKLDNEIKNIYSNGKILLNYLLFKSPEPRAQVDIVLINTCNAIKNAGNTFLNYAKGTNENDSLLVLGELIIETTKFLNSVKGMTKEEEERKEILQEDAPLRELRNKNSQSGISKTGITKLSGGSLGLGGAVNLILFTNPLGAVVGGLLILIMLGIGIESSIKNKAKNEQNQAGNEQKQEEHGNSAESFFNEKSINQSDESNNKPAFPQ